MLARAVARTGESDRNGTARGFVTHYHRPGNHDPLRTSAVRGSKVEVAAAWDRSTSAHLLPSVWPARLSFIDCRCAASGCRQEQHVRQQKPQAACMLRGMYICDASM